MTAQELSQRITEYLNLEDPYGVVIDRSAYTDSFDVKLYHRGSHMTYVRIMITPELLIGRTDSAFHSVEQAFKQLLVAVDKGIYFRCLHHITRHIGGHPLEGKIRF